MKTKNTHTSIKQFDFRIGYKGASLALHYPYLRRGTDLNLGRPNMLGIANCQLPRSVYKTHWLYKSHLQNNEVRTVTVNEPATSESLPQTGAAEAIKPFNQNPLTDSLGIKTLLAANKR